MESNLPQTVLHCTQCGGELHPDEGQVFLTCPYCSSTVYLDKARVVFHWYLAPTLDQDKARAALARWMASSQTVKDLDRKSTLTSVSFEYFPVWYFKRRFSGGQEEIVLEPAAATSVSEIRNVKLPAGDLRRYDESLAAEAQPPSVPLVSALSWMSERGVPLGEIAEQALVHIPLYTFKYTYQGRPFTALVEAATSGVFANLYPAKAETPYRTVGCISAAVFLCLATFPIIGYFSTSSAEGVGLGLLACAGLGILAAPLLFALAAYVAAKI